MSAYRFSGGVHEVPSNLHDNAMCKGFYAPSPELCAQDGQLCVLGAYHYGAIIPTIAITSSSGTQTVLGIPSAYVGVASEVAWSPDGQYLAIVLNKADLSGYSLFLYESDDSKPLLLSEHLDVYPWGIAWSPDSRWIVFSGAGRDDNLDVYMVNAETEIRQRLTTNPAGDYDPVWLPGVTTSEETNPYK